jgi:hypothetical protein
LAEQRASCLLLTGALLLSALPADAADEQPPDIAFIEYLGSWEEDDSDWLALAGREREAAETDGEPGRHERNDEEARDDDERG